MTAGQTLAMLSVFFTMNESAQKQSVLELNFAEFGQPRLSGFLLGREERTKLWHGYCTWITMISHYRDSMTRRAGAIFALAGALLVRMEFAKILPFAGPDFYI